MKVKLPLKGGRREVAGRLLEGWCNYTEDLRKLGLKPVVKKVKHPVNIRASSKAQELVSLGASRRQGCEGAVGR